jgi:hypothetical protein
VNTVVLDGASSNLAMVKNLSGYGKGAFSLYEDQEESHLVRPWFPNPLVPDARIYMIICPTHQVCVPMFISLNDFSAGNYWFLTFLLF